MTDGVLFVHAFPLDASMWEGQLDSLAGAAVPAAAVNLPGFGGANPAGDVTTMEIAAKSAVDELDSAGFDRAVVVGLSMGGYVALELWRRHPERVAGLVLANTRSQADPEEGKARRRALAEQLLREGTGSIIESQRALLSEDAPEGLWDRVAGIVMAQPAEAVAAASLGMAERPDSTPDLPGIDVPTLVITSTGDRLIPPEISTPMADAISQATLLVIEGAGHLSNLEAPEAFDAALHEHLQRCGLA